MRSRGCVNVLVLLLVCQQALSSKLDQILREEGNKLDGVKCPNKVLKKGDAVEITRSALVFLRKGDADKSKACLIKALKDSPRSSMALGAFGELLKRDGAATAKSVFDEAAQLGTSVLGVQSYDVLGPFSIGKAEVDGDPVEAPAFKGVQEARKSMQKKFPSEFAEGGQVEWKTVRARDGALDASFKDINWNKLIQLTNSMPILEWQAWAVGDFFILQEQTVKISCSGVHTFSVDAVGAPWFAGDMYRSQQLWTPLALAPGLHTIYTKREGQVRAKVSTQVQCRVLAVDSAQPLQLFGPGWLPDMVQGSFQGEGVASVPVVNLHPSAHLTAIRLSVPPSPPSKFAVGKKPQVQVEVHPMHTELTIAPGQTLGVQFTLSVASENGTPPSACAAPFKIRLQATVEGKEVEASTELLTVRCRAKENQSFLLSFLDHDLSVSRAAAIPPLHSCPSAGGTCPVVLSMHGTGVSANDQADSYKRQISKDVWEFGVRGAWTLAPTRHGAHNWEVTGMRSALSALSALATMTEGGWHGFGGADRARVVFAGHSMGGHGAWHIATHFPDLALAVSTAAGWIRKEYYGDSNVLWEHDTGVAHADAHLKAVLEGTVAESYVDLLAPNLRGTPVLARIGSEDRAVPPWQQRRMFRLLTEHKVKVVWDELPGKEHWWWDTERESDGGCVNDHRMRSFMRGALSANSSLAFATPDPTTAAALPVGVASVPPPPEEFELVVVNPGSSGPRGGLFVLQLRRPFLQARITASMSDKVRVLVTRNVRRLAFAPVLGAAEPYPIPSGGVQVDDTHLSYDKVRALYAGWPEDGQHLCLRDDKGAAKSWEVCGFDPQSAPERGPLEYGPARQVSEAAFQVVVGTLSAPDPPTQTCPAGPASCPAFPPSSSLLQAGAVYLANLHRSAMDTLVDIVPDHRLPPLPPSHNLLLLGSPDTNAYLAYLQSEGLLPIRFGPQPASDSLPALSAGAIALGPCVFSGPGIGYVVTVPLRRGFTYNASQAAGRVGLVVGGTDRDGLRDALSLGVPTIPPMVRAPYTNMHPDFIVTGRHLAWKGVGGMLAAGHWGNRWEFASDLAWTHDQC